MLRHEPISIGCGKCIKRRLLTKLHSTLHRLLHIFISMLLRLSPSFNNIYNHLFNYQLCYTNIMVSCLSCVHWNVELCGSDVGPPSPSLSAHNLMFLVGIPANVTVLMRFLYHSFRYHSFMDFFVIKSFYAKIKQR